ncbi:MAG: hypothetical protein U0Q11_14165 [Vicinamibacterales bacterium]
MPTDLELFAEAAGSRRLRLPAGDAYARSATDAPEAVDALFHLPLLALAIMTIAAREKFQTVNLGKRVAALLVEHFVALRNSAHAMDTSLTLRRRCVSALVLLEIVGLVAVSRDRWRFIEVTPDGRKSLNDARRAADDLGLLVRGLRIAQDKSSARIGKQ